MSGGLVFPCLSEFSTIDCDPHLKGFGIVSKAEIDVFLELSCFFDDPADVGKLVSGSSALSNSMKLNPALWGHPRQTVMVERSNRMWSTGEGNGKPLQYSCLENPMNSMSSMKNGIDDLICKTEIETQT